MIETFEPAAPGATETAAEPVDELKLESPEYAAVTLALPTGKTLPVTVRVAMAAPAAFTIGLMPRRVRPVLKVTVPLGTAPFPAAGATVAVSCTESPNAMLEGLTASETVVPAAVVFHWVTKL